MATLTDLHHPEPAGGASSRSYTLASRPKHSPSSSMASAVQFRSHRHNRSRSNTSRSVASQTVPEHSYLPSSSVPDFQKPGLKYKSSRSSSTSQHTLTIDVDSALYQRTPSLSSAIVDGSPCSSVATPKDKLRQGLRRFSRNEESLDLSRTAAENEEKFGLGIYSLKSESPLHTAADVNFSSTKSIGPHSWNHRRSHEARSFKPSQPYTLPTAPSKPKTLEIHEIPSSMSIPPNLFVPPEEAELEAAFGVPSMTETMDTWSTVSGRDRYPLQSAATSDSPRRSFEILESNTSISSTFTRPRRSTNQSTEATTPQSRTSLDRVFSLNKSGKEPVDPIKRQASIQAARQAFNEREEAKARKYEEKERRAIHREETKRVREVQRERRRSIAQEERERRRSNAHERKRSQASPEAIEDDLVSGPAYSNIKTSVDGPPRALPPSEIKAIDVPMKKSHRPKKKGIKWRYLNFVTWGNVRILRMKERGEANST